MIKQELQTLIDAAQRSVSNLLKKYGNSSDPKLVKKASILSYWLKDYMRMIHKEETFNPAFVKRHKRGDIIQVHLGFNLGCEEGGLHYAVVISNFNPATSDVLTIVPLTSKKSTTKVRKQNIDLGNTLYDQLKEKYNNAAPPLKEELSLCNNQLRDYHDLLFNLAQDVSDTHSENSNLMDCVDKINEITQRISVLNSNLETLEKIQEEISHMKEGSIALVGQITTISKIRIYNPTKKEHSLNGIRLSDEQLDLIDCKIKELYTNS